MIRKIGTFDSEKILKEINSLNISYKQHNQFCLQGVEKNSDPLYGARKITEMNHNENDFKKFLFEIPYTNFLLEEFQLVRSRVMNVEKKSCLSYHKDPSDRVHFPLITNDDVFYVIEDKVFRMNEKNVIYLLPSTKKHTIVNASTKDRLHLVGVAPY